jgi:hypothetical protein
MERLLVEIVQTRSVKLLIINKFLLNFYWKIDNLEFMIEWHVCESVFLFQAAGLQFRGQRIWLAAMEELMSQGIKNAEQVSHFSLCCYSILICMDSNQCISGPSLRMLRGWSNIHNTLWWVPELVTKTFQSEVY